MKHDLFSKYLRVIIVGMTLIGLVCCAYVIPELARTFEEEYPEFSYWVMPWLVLIYVCAIPCFAAMGISWKIAVNIGKDRSFTMENSKLFKIYSYLAIGDTTVFLVGSIAFTLLGMNHPGLILVDLLIVFMGLAVFVCTSALSYLVGKAATLQEDNNLTI